MALTSLDDLVAAIPPGATLAVTTDYSGVAMAATAALSRRGTNNLHLLCVPASGMQADIIVGGGLVSTL
jgi:glutaconate CoA-transferase subunit A